MIYHDLFQKILIEPAASLVANQLWIVSKDVNSEIIFEHFEQLDKAGCSIEVDLTVGSAVEAGLSTYQHQQISELCKSSAYSSRLRCHYITEGAPVYSNFYIWLNEQGPVVAYFGSASYTYKCFNSISRNMAVEIDAFEAVKYRNSLLEDAVCCLDDKALAVVQQVPTIYNDIEWMFTDCSGLGLPKNQPWV